MSAVAGEHGSRGRGAALALALGVTTVPAVASASLPGWTHVEPVGIQENSGQALMGVQVQLSIDTQSLIGANLLQADGSDLRFAYDCVGDDLIDYWIDPATIGTSDTRVWVLVDLPAGVVTVIGLFSGNPAASAASALDQVFEGPYSGNGSLSGGSTGGYAQSHRGFRFTPNQDVLITDFGKNEPTGTNRYVTLWDFATSSMLLQQQVAGGAGTYSYAPLTDPMWLTAGHGYVISLFSGAGDGYYFQMSTSVGSHLTYGDMRYCNDCTQNTFPTDVLGGYHYGYPDFQYWVKQEVSPSPTQTNGAMCSQDAMCDGDCTVASCGDGYLNTDAGEQCDDGNNVDGDGCSSTCTVEVMGTTTSGGTGVSATGGPATSGGPGTTSQGGTGGGPGTGGGVTSAGGVTGGGSGGPTAGGTATGGTGATGGSGGIPFDNPSVGKLGCGCGAGGPTDTGWLAMLGLLGMVRRRRSLRSCRSS